METTAMYLEDLFEKPCLKVVQAYEDMLTQLKKNNYLKLFLEPEYVRLPQHHSLAIRSIYDFYAKSLRFDPSKPLYTHNGIQISHGFERIVVGDYGAYIEFSINHVYGAYITPKKEAYRKLPEWRNKVKYIWYTTECNDCKIYYQLKRVSYADYIPKRFYVSPYEVVQI